MQFAPGRAAVFAEANKPLDVRTYPVAAPLGADVLLQLQRSGICGTDIHIVENRLPIPPPFIPGHEFIGRIAELGPRAATDGLGRRLRKGDSAIACVALACGKCFTCRQGETASCLRFGVTYLRDPAKAPHFFGGYADYLFAPAHTLVHIPKDVDLDAAAAFPCAGPTCIRAFDFAGGARAGELVVVQGTGPVGLFAIAWARKAGCTVIAIGSSSSPARMKMARALGAREVIDYRATTAPARLARIQALAVKLRRGNGADVVFEASGSPAAIPEGLNLVRTLGRYIVPGQYSNSGSVAIDPQLITFKAIKIIGSGQYKLADVGAYLAFLRKHRDLQRAFARCVTHRFPVAAANAALRTVSRGAAVKAVFVPAEDVP